MKNLTLIFLVLALGIFVVAPAQSFAMQNSNQQNSDQTKQDDAKTQQNISGKVSKDGKKFVNDKDSKSWKVDNPDMTKGHEGQQVAMIVVVDPETNEIHIISLEPESPK
jgi:hypothetical protein